MDLNERLVEDATITWRGELCYAVVNWPHIAQGEPAAVRYMLGAVVPIWCLGEAIRRRKLAIHKSHTFATLQDTLLPRPVSVELSVDTSDKIVVGLT